MGQTTAFQPEDLRLTEQIQEAALSPDGSTIVYSRRVIVDNAYRTHLWTVPWSGGAARQLTHAVANDTRPVFSRGRTSSPGSGVRTGASTACAGS